MKRGITRTVLLNLMVVGLISPAGVPVYAEDGVAMTPSVAVEATEDADVSLEMEALTHEISGADAEIVESAGVFKGFKTMKDLASGATKIEKMGFWAGAGTVLSTVLTGAFVEEALSPASALKSAFAASETENDQKIKIYYEALWGNFLNDPLYMGHFRGEPRNIYIREVFAQATAVVKKILSDNNININFSSEKVFLSETPSPHFEINKGEPDLINGDVNFYIPATAFFVGSKAEKVKKVALALLSQVAAISFDHHLGHVHKEVNKIMDCYTPRGNPQFVCYGPNGMVLDSALKFWSVIKYRSSIDTTVEMPDFTKDDFSIFAVDYHSYLKESDGRNVYYRLARTVEEFERRYLSFRADRTTTTKGPQTGPVGISPCTIVGQEFVINHPLKDCVTIHLKSLNEPQYENIILKTIASERNKEFRGAPGTLIAEQLGGILLSLTTTAVLGRVLDTKYLKKYSRSLGAKFAHFILPFGAYFVGSEAGELVVRATDTKNHYFRLKETKLKASFEDLDSWHQFFEADGPDNAQDLASSMNKILTSTDSDTIEALLKLAR